MKTNANMSPKRVVMITAAALLILFVLFQVLPQRQAQPQWQLKVDNKSLVLYFSRAENIIDASEYLDTLGDDTDAMTSASVLKTEDGEITGNIGLMARWIAEKVGADMHSIQVEELYPQLKKETQNIVLQEQLDGVWPEIVPTTETFEQYDTVYIGFPNWYAEPPRALYTFLEEHDLDGKTIIPFTSDDRNGFSDAVDILKSKLPNSIVLSEEDGLLVNRVDLFDAKERTQKWASLAIEKVESAKTDPLGTSEAQKEAALALVGQTVTHEEIKEKVGEYTKFAKGTNG